MAMDQQTDGGSISKWCNKAGSETVIDGDAYTRQPVPDTVNISNIPKLEYYRMSKQSKGCCIIFNQKKFKSSLLLDEREGTDQDCASCKEVFENMGFVVQVYTDHTVKKIMQILAHVSQDESLDSQSCIVIVFMSHGKENCVYSYDTQFHPAQLLQHFTSSFCSKLVKKPKLFLMQTCRGEESDTGIGMYSGDDGDDDEDGDKTNCAPSQEVQTKSEERCDSKYVKQKTQEYLKNFEWHSLEEDIVVFWSTVPGCVSFRHLQYGSRFIRSLTSELKKNWKSKSFYEIAVAVQRDVATNYPKSKSEQDAKQCCEYMTAATKILHFNPPAN